VIVDDGSNDDEFRYLLNTIDRTENSNISLIRHSHNRGGAAARNTGVRASKNQWLFNLDADNIVSEDLIKELFKFAISNDVNVACPETICFFNGQINKITHEWVFDKRDITFLDHLRSPYVPSASGNYLFSRSAFENAGGFPEYAGGLDAWGFGLRLVATGSRMKICPSTSYFHRYGHDSYYVRESRRAEKQNLIATSLVLEYSDLCDPRLIRKLFSRTHRSSWFSNLQDNPFHIQTEASGRVVNY